MILKGCFLLCSTQLSCLWLATHKYICVCVIFTFPFIPYFLWFIFKFIFIFWIIQLNLWSIYMYQSVECCVCDGLICAGLTLKFIWMINAVHCINMRLQKVVCFCPLVFIICLSLSQHCSFRSISLG